MLTDARDVLAKAASIDTAQVAGARRFLRAVVDRSARIAVAMRWIWLGAALLEVGLGVTLVLTLRSVTAPSLYWPVACGITLGLLAALCVLVAWGFHLVAGLPARVDSLSDAALGAVTAARTDQTAATRSTGWRGTLRILWGAARVLRTVYKAAVDHGNDALRGFVVLVWMANPLTWALQLFLALLCLAAPAVFAAAALFLMQNELAPA